jgi:hypothetical protein
LRRLPGSSMFRDGDRPKKFTGCRPHVRLCALSAGKLEQAGAGAGAHLFSFVGQRAAVDLRRVVFGEGTTRVVSGM